MIVQWFLKRHWNSIQTVTKDSNNEFTMIMLQYASADRRYHVTGHILHGLRVIDRLADNLNIPHAGVRLLKFAFFYHDAIYKAENASGANEQQSADFAEDYLKKVLSSSYDVNTVLSLILATASHSKDHEEFNKDPSFRTLWPIMSDADLAILSAPWTEYQRYAHGIWVEYSKVYGRPKFARGRVAFLSQMTFPVYRTREMLVRAEADAEDNIKREIENLKAEIASDGASYLDPKEGAMTYV